MMQRPGPMVDGPGPGVLPMMAPPPQRPMAITTSQVRFVGPDGMKVGWQVPGGFAESQLIAPARYNFVQGQAYRLKLTSIPGMKVDHLPDAEGLSGSPEHGCVPFSQQSARAGQCGRP